MVMASKCEEKQASKSWRMKSMMWCVSRTRKQLQLSSHQHSWQTISCLAFVNGTQRCAGAVILLSLKPTFTEWWTTSQSCSPTNIMQWSQLMVLSHWQQALIAHKLCGRCTSHSRLACLITDMLMMTWHQCIIYTPSGASSRQMAMMHPFILQALSKRWTHTMQACPDQSLKTCWWWHCMSVQNLVH